MQATNAQNGHAFLRSIDGVNWVPSNLPRVGTSQFGPSLVFANGRFLGLRSYEGMWYSDDGLTATNVPIPPDWNFQPEGVAFGNDIWLVTLPGGKVLRSTDNCVTWQLHETPAAHVGTVVFGNGRFLADAHSGSLLSTDGLTWTIGPEIPGGWLCYEAGRFQTTTHVSTSGSSWSATSALPSSTDVLRSGGGRFVTWSNSAGPQPLFYSSTNGSSWSSPATAPVLDEVANAAFCGDLWIAVTASGRILTSPTPTQLAPVAPILDVAPALRLSWQSQTGRTYIIQRSVNQTTWTDQTGAMLGTGTLMEWLAPASASREFFRVVVR